MRFPAVAVVLVVLSGCPGGSGSTTVPTTLSECPEVVAHWTGGITPGVSGAGTSAEQPVGTTGTLDGTDLSTGPGPTVIDDKTFPLSATPPYPEVRHSLGNAAPGCSVVITTTAITVGRPCTGSGTWRLSCDGINGATGAGTWRF